MNYYQWVIGSDFNNYIYDKYKDLLITFLNNSNDFKSKTLDLHELENAIITLIETNMALTYMAFSKPTKIKLNFGDIFVVTLNEKNPSLSGEVGNRVSKFKLFKPKKRFSYLVY